MNTVCLSTRHMTNTDQVRSVVGWPTRETSRWLIRLCSSLYQHHDRDHLRARTLENWSLALAFFQSPGFLRDLDINAKLKIHPSIPHLLHYPVMGRGGTGGWSLSQLTLCTTPLHKRSPLSERQGASGLNGKGWSVVKSMLVIFSASRYIYTYRM